MLSGRRAFDGPSSSDVLVSVLEREPDWSALPDDTPLPVRRLLRRCLQKDVRRRLRDAGDARLELEDAATLDPRPDPPSDRVAAPVARRSWMRTAAMLAAGVAIGATLMALFAPAPAGPVPRPVQFSVTLADGERLGTTDLSATAMSPDGRLVTYLVGRGSTTQLLLRRLEATGVGACAGHHQRAQPVLLARQPVDWLLRRRQVEEGAGRRRAGRHDL